MFTHNPVTRTHTDDVVQQGSPNMNKSKGGSVFFIFYDWPFKSHCQHHADVASDFTNSEKKRFIVEF